MEFYFLVKTASHQKITKCDPSRILKPNSTLFAGDSFAGRERGWGREAVVVVAGPERVEGPELVVDF